MGSSSSRSGWAPAALQSTRISGSPLGLPSPGTLEMSADTLDCRDSGEGCWWHPVGRSQGCRCYDAQGGPHNQTSGPRASSAAGDKARPRTFHLPTSPSASAPPPTSQGVLLLSLRATNETPRTVRGAPEQMLMSGICVFQIHEAPKDDRLRRAPEAHPLFSIYVAFPESS